MNNKQVIIEVSNSDSILKNGDSQACNHLYNKLAFRPSTLKYSNVPPWVGWERLYNQETNKFPTGLVSLAIKELDSIGYSCEIVDCRGDPEDHQLDKIYFKMEEKFPPLRKYQEEAIQQVLSKGRGVVEMATGCHAKGTRILSYDGKFILVENIQVGDRLMGDDSTPRIVLGLYRGREEMFSIDIGQESFVVNKSHILSLKDHRGDIINCSVDEYIKNEAHYFHYRLYKNAVEFGFSGIVADPYEVGLTINSGNESLLADIDLNRYLINKREVRLQFLAGLIDSRFVSSEDAISVYIDNKKYFNPIWEMIRGLGFKDFCDYKNDRIIIMGAVTDIPSRNPLIKEVKDFDYDGRYSFNISSVGQGDYYGFELDKNHLYVMENFYVTHNTGKTVVMMESIKRLGQKTLYIVPKSSIMTQAVDTFKKYFKANQIGQISGNKKQYDKAITIATYQSLLKTPKEFFDSQGAVFIDEFHHCLLYDTNMEYVDGKKGTAQEAYDAFIAKGKIPAVKSWDFEQEKWVRGRVTNAFRYPSPKTMVRITVKDENGALRKITTTDLHNIYTPLGKVLAKDLKIQDKICLGYLTHKDAMRNRSENEDYRAYLSKRASVNNKNRSEEVRESQRKKMKKLIKDKKIVAYGRGKYGNGGEMTPTQIAVCKILSSFEPKTEHIAVPSDGEYPHHYKIDVAIPHKGIAIEIDGNSHNREERQIADDRKDKRLEVLGWEIIRIKEGCPLERLLTLKELVEKRENLSMTLK